jgi:CRP-like cAMP-binding protein
MNMTQKWIRELAGLDLFAGCRRTTLAYVDRLGCTLDVLPGRTLCREGAAGEEFFILTGGLVDVRTASGTFAVLCRGAWFGEAALTDGKPRRATVRARTNSRLLVFNRREFRSLLEAAPCVRERVGETAARVIAGGAPTSEPWYRAIAENTRYLDAVPAV